MTDQISSTDLNNATEPGPKNAYPSTPGEFAARWNQRDENGRLAFLNNLIDASMRSSRCFQMNHDGLQEELDGTQQELVHARASVRRIEAMCDAFEKASDDVLAGLASEIRSILKNGHGVPGSGESTL